MTTVHSVAWESGQELPTVGPIAVTLEDGVRWAAATGDFSPFHYDAEAARARGFDGPVAHGPWKAAKLRSLLPQWLGPVKVARFSARYLAPNLAGDQLTFGGRIVDVHPTADHATAAECELWVVGADGRTSVAADCTVTAVERLDALPLDRISQAVKLGEVAGTVTYRVTADDIARFIEAVNGEAPPVETIVDAPATFFAALDPVERRDIDLDGLVQTLPFRKTGGGNAFNEVSYARPIRAGDVVTVTTRYTEVYEKKGSRGTLLFRVRENELRAADGELIATTRNGHVMSYDIAAPTGGAA